nr:MAG TPA: hypothetical protein [Caudoviricetes sp.]
MTVTQRAEKQRKIGKVTLGDTHIQTLRRREKSKNYLYI